MSAWFSPLVSVLKKLRLWHDECFDDQNALSKFFNTNCQQPTLFNEALTPSRRSPRCNRKRQYCMPCWTRQSEVPNKEKKAKKEKEKEKSHGDGHFLVSNGEDGCIQYSHVESSSSMCALIVCICDTTTKACLNAQNLDATAATGMVCPLFCLLLVLIECTYSKKYLRFARRNDKERKDQHQRYL